MNIAFLQIAVIFAVVYGEYPASLPKCENKDEACLVKTTQEYIDKYHKGLPDVNLLPFEPRHIESIVLKQNPGSPVNADIRLTNVDLIGLKNMKVSSMKMSNTDLSGRSELIADIPDFIVKGNYNINGSVLILPIQGAGKFEVKCKKINLKYSFDLKPIERSDKTYARLEHVKLVLKAEFVHFNFENLFNGNNQLGDTMNVFLNENWKDVFDEINPGLSKSLGLEIKQILNTFFDSYPYIEYFL